jgi:cell wall assembly regulator SMI1
VLPTGDAIGKDIKIDLETGPESRSPQIIHIRENGADLTLKIVNSEIRPGRVILLDHDRRFRADELEAVLSDD